MPTKGELEIEVQELKQQQEEQQRVFEEQQKALDEVAAEKESLIEENKELKLRVDKMREEVSERVRQAILEFKSENGKAGIFKKIAIVMDNVRRVKKSGWNDFHKYAYASEADIVDGIRPILAEAGLALWTTVVSESRDLRPMHNKYKPNDPPHMKWFTKVGVKFILGDAETGETLESIYYGEGEDESDKGLYKAYTGAQKYFLTKTFLISSGDVVDTVPSDPEFHNASPNEPRYGQNQPNTGGGYKNASQGAQMPNNGMQNQQPKNQNIIQPKKEQLLAKWRLLGGDDASFENFYAKQSKHGATHYDINVFLDKQMAAKKPQTEASSEVVADKNEE